MEGHIVSIVPSRDYYQRYGIASGDRFAPVGSDFDGIVFYTSLNCIDIVRLEKYSRGMLVETAEVDLSANDPKDRYGKFDYAFKFIRLYIIGFIIVCCSLIFILNKTISLFIQTRRLLFDHIELRLFKNGLFYFRAIRQ